MAGIFEKLNFGERQELVVLNPPQSLQAELSRLPVLHLHHHLTAVRETEFLLAFVIRKAEVDVLAPQVDARAKGDAVIWFAYPKKSSKNHTCNFSRNTGWDALHARGFDSVRSVSMDADWTALCFRRVEFAQARS